MLHFWIKVGIYFFSFLISIYALTALDFNRFLKKGKSAQGQILFILFSFAMAYLIGSFIINMIYILN